MIVLGEVLHEQAYGVFLRGGSDHVGLQIGDHLASSVVRLVEEVRTFTNRDAKEPGTYMNVVDWRAGHRDVAGAGRIR